MLLVQIPVIPTTTPSTSMLVRDSQINPTMPLSWILLWELIRHAPRPEVICMSKQWPGKMWSQESHLDTSVINHLCILCWMTRTWPLGLLPGSPLYYTDLYTWLTFQIILNVPKKTDYASNVFVPALFSLPCD